MRGTVLYRASSSDLSFPPTPAIATNSISVSEAAMAQDIMSFSCGSAGGQDGLLP